MNIDFNEDWTFIKTDGSFEIVDLPHDAMIHEMRTIFPEENTPIPRNLT